MGITSREANYEIAKNIVLRNPAKFVEFIRSNKNKLSFSFKKSRVDTYLIQSLYEKGLSIDKLSKIFSLTRQNVKSRLRSRVSEANKNVFEFLHAKDIFNLVNDIPFQVEISKQRVKKIIAIELILKGHSNKDIADFLEVSIRSVERFKKELKEEGLF